MVIFAILGFKATHNVDRCIEWNRHQLEGANLLGVNDTMEKYEDFMSTINETEVGNLKLEKCSLEDQLNNAAEGTGLAFIVFTQ